jgi:WS/DGAT/MGAT family acyltransferase
VEQLPGSDALFLAVETDTVYTHIGGVTILDPTDAPGFGYARLLEIAAARLREVPRLTKKLRRVPLDLDRPYLVDDPDFEVEKHVHRIAVPSPGGFQELAEVVGHLYSRHLDRRKSLWEMWLIEGLADGRFALFFKTHHAIMDGAAGVGFAELFFDTEPNPPPRPLARKDPPAREPRREPGAVLLATRGLQNVMRTPFRLLRYGVQLARQLRVMLPYLREPEMPSVTGLPRVSFNAPLGPERAFAWISVPLAAVKEIKTHYGVKVNDVLLALTGSAVRRYLKARGELPNEPLAAAVPVSTRGEDDASLGNQLTATSVSCATDVPDPAERLLRIHKSATTAKEMEKAMREQELSALGDTAPPRLINLAFRALAGAGLSVPTNVAVSNVAGPPIPLYIAGARVEHIYPMSVLLPSSGLNVTVFSYCGQVDFGFTVDPELVPDPWSLADGIPVALTELRERIPGPRGAPGEAPRGPAPRRARRRRLKRRSRHTSRR